MLVYDITRCDRFPFKETPATEPQPPASRQSFTNLSRWLADARALASPQLVTVLVGCKSDREDEREVEWAEASRWAAENGTTSAPNNTLVHNDLKSLTHADLHFMETSALSGDNVEAPFLLAARSILLSIESGQLDPEKQGSGVSYGDRGLRRISSSSRMSFLSASASGQPTRRRRGAIRLLGPIGPALRGDCC